MWSLMKNWIIFFPSISMYSFPTVTLPVTKKTLSQPYFSKSENWELLLFSVLKNCSA